MRTLPALLMLVAALAVAPAASASHACNGPGTAAEVCYSTGSQGGDVHSKSVAVGGCIISVQGFCVPDSVSVGNGPALATYVLPTVYVGVDVNLCPPYIADCSVIVDTAPATATVAGLT